MIEYRNAIKEFNKNRSGEHPIESIDTTTPPKEPSKPEIFFEIFWNNNRNRQRFSNIDVINSNYITIRRVSRVKIQYYKADEISIEINLEHSISPNPLNSYFVEGINNTTVHGISGEISELISNWKTQDMKWLHENRQYVNILFLTPLFSLVASGIFVGLLSWLVPQFHYNLLWVGALAVGLLMVMYFGAFNISGKVISIYPCIEFSIGPDHQKIEEIKRKKLWNIYWMIIIPSIISLIFSIISFLLRG